MLTRKGAVLAAAVVGLGAVAVVADASALALAAVPLLLVLALAVVDRLAPRAPLEAARTVSAPRLVAGDEADLRLRVANPGRTRGLVEVSAELPRGAHADAGGDAFLARLGGGASARARCRLAASMRGRYALDEVVVRERGPLGLMRRDERVPAPVAFTVFPAAEPFEGWRFRRRARHAIGAFRAGRIGAGSEFFGLRQYLAGDPIDAVNWRQTAKVGRPIVNEHEHEAPADVVVVLDARAHTDVGAGRTSTLEAGVRAAASVAARAVKEHYKVGLVVLAEKATWVHPAAGRRQHERIVETLLDVRAGGDAPLAATLPALPPQVLPKASNVVLVSPCFRDRSIPAAVESLFLRGLDVLVVSPSPESAELADAADPRRPASLPPPLAYDVAARVLARQRARFLERVRRAGAHVVDWDVRRPLADAFADAAPREVAP